MKKEIKYWEYYCDRCEEKVDKLYGNYMGGVLVKLENIEQSQQEECVIVPKYYLAQNGGRKISSEESGICKNCLTSILLKAINNLDKM